MHRVLPLVALAALLVAGCAGKKVPPPSADLWKQATESFDDGAYDLAIENYKALLDQYPFDTNAEEAELKIAHAYYLSGRYPEAIAAFENFERMHPTSQHLASVEYHRGMSYAMQHGAADRDQRYAQAALTSFRNVIDRFPSGAWASKAELRIRECREALARHESDVAGFYLERTSLRAAESRLSTLLTDYGDTDATADALVRFADQYAERGERDAADLAYATVAYRHPDGPQATHARAQLGPDHPMLRGVDPTPQLLEWIEGAKGAESRRAVPRSVSAFSDSPGARGPRY